MAQINILNYVKCVYERHKQILNENNISDIENYKSSLKNAIALLEYEIDDEYYVINSTADNTNAYSTTDNIDSYNKIVKLSLFSYLLNQIN